MTTTTAGAFEVSGALARRHLLGMTRVPAALVPTIMMPVFFVVAFGGSFGGVADLPGFPTDNFLNWVTPFAILQGCAFAGFGSAFHVARDLETGFYDRLLASPVDRRALVAGPLTYSFVRALLPLALVLPLAMAGGARFDAGPIGLLPLFVAAEGVALLSALWGLGVAYRLRTQQSGALVQVGIFVSMFLSTGQVPLDLQEGWLHSVARVNPITNVLALARQGLLGEVSWDATWPGLVAIAAMGGVLGLFAKRGFDRLVP